LTGGSDVQWPRRRGNRHPAHYDFKAKGKPVHETGTWTFAFQKLSGSWKIAGWTWSRH
jgi:hypothetical protein